MATIEETIQSMIPRLTDEVAAEIRNKCIANMTYDISKQVTAEVGKHIEEVILPAVRLELQEHEAEIKASVVAAVKATFAAVGEKLVKHTVEKLAGYEGDKLLTQMLGPLLRGY